MEVRAPEAGLPIDRGCAFVIVLNQVLVQKFGARPISIKFLIDSQRLNGVDGHYEAEYELRNGANLKVHCKQVKDDMMFRVSRGSNLLSYSVKLGKYVNDDLVPISMAECEDLVSHWLKD